MDAMNKTNQKIYDYLLTYGFSPLHKGFKMIIDAVNTIYEREFKYKSLSDIYAEISPRYGITPQSMQKDIKNAIDSANLRCPADRFTDEFWEISNPSGITCAMFLCYVASKAEYM